MSLLQILIVVYIVVASILMFFCRQLSELNGGFLRRYGAKSVIILSGIAAAMLAYDTITLLGSGKTLVLVCFMALIALIVFGRELSICRRALASLKPHSRGKAAKRQAQTCRRAQVTINTVLDVIEQIVKAGMIGFACISNVGVGLLALAAATILSAYQYDPAAKTPLWRRVLLAVVGLTAMLAAFYYGTQANILISGVLSSLAVAYLVYLAGWHLFSVVKSSQTR